MVICLGGRTDVRGVLKCQRFETSIALQSFPLHPNGSMGLHNGPKVGFYTRYTWSDMEPLEMAFSLGLFFTLFIEAPKTQSNIFSWFLGPPCTGR